MFKTTINHLLFGGRGGGDLVADVGLAVLRVASGLFLAFGHGLGKVPPSQGFVESVAGMGFPLPTLNAWVAGLGELLGGLMLALGLATRVAAAWIVGVFFVAAFLAHGDSFGSAADFFLPVRPDEKPAAEPAVLYLLIGVTFALVGSGRTGLDQFLRRR